MARAQGWESRDPSWDPDTLCDLVAGERSTFVKHFEIRGWEKL